jgi:hypothetical protein
MAPAPSATPFLDRETLLPKPKRRTRLFPVLVGTLIGLAGDYLAMRTDSIGFWALWVLGFLPALFLGILLHELGHLVAGRLAGFEFYRILAGPWMLARESSGYKLRFLPKRILAVSGQTSMIPRTTENLRRGFALFAAGGPVMTALLFVPLLFLPWGPVASCLLAANLVLAFFSWIPMTISGSHTDGKILRTLAREGPLAERFVAILYVMAIDSRGVEPRLWPREIVDRLSAEVPGPAGSEFLAEAVMLLHLHLRDGGDPTVVAAALERVLANAGRLRADLRRLYFAEAAFFQGVYRNNAERARAWLEDARKIKGGVALKDWDAGALAAIALAEGKPAEARQCIDRAIALLDRQPGTPGVVIAERRRLMTLAASLPEGAAMAASNPSK